ncbi:MAG: aldose 1-epimerase family protein [Bacteroidia bacterium]
MIEHYSIRNEYLEVGIKRLGAELCSVKDKSGKEFIWQAGDVWQRHAPNLFPIVGSLLDHMYIYNGKEYDLKHHGFARDMNFDMLHQSEHSICFVLQESEETLKSYPFSFTFLVTYTLERNKLIQKYRVINRSDVDMPASVGGHPAFNALPIDEYYLEFEKEESVSSNQLEGPYINESTVDIIQGKTINLSKNIFDNDALIFQGLKSSYVILRHRNSSQSIKVDFADFRYLGIWAKPGAPYVCIEPWQGLADYIYHDKVIESKKGIVILTPGEEMIRSFSMEFTS